MKRLVKVVYKEQIWFEVRDVNEKVLVDDVIFLVRHDFNVVQERGQTPQPSELRESYPNTA